MKYGQTVEWSENRKGVLCRFAGKVLDVIPAGEPISERSVVIARKIKVNRSDISVYDRVLVEVEGARGNSRYRAPRLAKIRRI